MMNLRLRAALPLCLAAAALTALPGAAAATPTLSAGLDRAKATVGDRVAVVLTLSGAGGARDLTGEPRFPSWGTRWGEAEIVASDPVVKEVTPQGTVYHQRVVLTAFKTGRFALPPVAVTMPLRSGAVVLATPDGLGFEVRSVLPAGEKDPQPRPAAPPLPLPAGRAFWWTLTGFAAAIALAAWAHARKRRARGEAAAEKPFLSPFAELAAALERLRQTGSALEVHTGLSLALRRYLARRLPFPAIESTTSEIQRQLHSRRLPHAVARPTVELLRACDLVKFARRPASERDSASRLEAARGLVQEYEAHFAPPAPAPREAAS